jgi:peroxiredoxin
MTNNERRPPLRPGDAAPDFVLPAVNHDGSVALTDYRGKSPVLLAMMRGLYCAFCRRHIAQLGTTRQKLQALGVEALAIVPMQPERLRLYYRFRPVSVPVAADPEMMTHRAYGVPQPPLTAEITQAVSAKYLDLANRLEIATTDQTGIRKVLCEKDGFEPIVAEQKDRRDWSDRHGAQMIGQFLIDRGGIVRWVNIEGAKEGLAGLENFPTDDEFLAAAQKFSSADQRAE